MGDIFNHKIVTNNPSVKDKYRNIVYVNGSFKDVLLKTRDLVHQGSKLINHPLGASSRMFFSPYRSIIIQEKINGGDEYHIRLIENSIETYDKHIESRSPDLKNRDDYSFLDRELLDSALDELKRIYN